MRVFNTNSIADGTTSCQHEHDHLNAHMHVTRLRAFASYLPSCFAYPAIAASNKLDLALRHACYSSSFSDFPFFLRKHKAPFPAHPTLPPLLLRIFRVKPRRIPPGWAFSLCQTFDKLVWPVQYESMDPEGPILRLSVLTKKGLPETVKA